MNWRLSSHGSPENIEWREKKLLWAKKDWIKRSGKPFTWVSICGVRFSWGFPAYPQGRFYFRGSENCISVRFKQSVSEIQLCIEVVFFFSSMSAVFFMICLFLFEEKCWETNTTNLFPSEKNILFWAPSSSVSAIWQFLPAAGASGNSDHLLKNVPWLCKGKYSTLASSALARLSSRLLLAHAPGSLLCGIMSRVGLCISHRYLFSSSGRTLWLYSGST